MPFESGKIPRFTAAAFCAGWSFGSRCRNGETRAQLPGIAASIAIMAPFEELRAEEQNGANVSGVKAALQMIGIDCGPTRPPSAWPLSEPQSRKMRARLAAWGLVAS